MTIDARLDQVNIVVKDMDAMAAFYNRLGLRLNDSLPEWAPHHRSAAVEGGAAIDLDSQAFAGVWNQGWPGGPGVVLGFGVERREDVDAAWAELTGAGYAGQQPPYDAFWGSRYAVVTDPDGNAVGIMSPPDPAHRGDPPPPP